MTEVLAALKDVSTAELERIVEARKKQETDAEKAKREAYEKNKNNLVYALCHFGIQLNDELLEFKQKAFNELRKFYEEMKAYGDVKEANKGNFSIKSADGKYMIKYSRQAIGSFDERANLAEQKLREFLAETVKKREKAIYELVMGLLERNKLSGDFDSNNIQKLYKLEDKFDHPLWKESIKLFKESFNETGTNYYARFFAQDSTGKFKNIDLNFSSLNVD
mgnify:CR=1 FL=1